MSTNLQPEHWPEWEVDPSTRTSVHPFTKYSPITATVGTTAADLYTVSRGKPAANLVTNPSIEAADITMFTASGAAISRSETSVGQLGDASLLVNPSNSAAGEGFYWTTPIINGHPEGSWLMAHCEVRGASASGDVKISIQSASGTELAASATHSLSTSFTKISTQYNLPVHSPTAFRIAVVSVTNHNIDFYVDKFMVEHRRDSNISTYVDGSLGINYEWLGTANASESRLRAAGVMIRGLRLKNDDGSNPIYIAFDTTASTTTGIKIVGGETFETNFPLDFRTNISAIATGGNVAVHGVVWGMHQG